MHTLLVFSHLRWSFVYQRPQHLLSRIAKQWRVIFVEEPVPQAPANRMEKIDVSPGVTVWRAHLRGAEPGFHPANQMALHALTWGTLSDEGIDSFWAWLYTPMALPIAQDLHPEGVIYDCMDELSAFRHAPAELLQREQALFRIADLVFTGGRSLHTAKSAKHANIHCFPSSVDAQHFRSEVEPHALLRDMPQPRLGYCGVIDERIDLDLIAGIADARPNWQIVLVGPTAKIDADTLPRRPNIHWLGQQDYQDLPALINGWDICLLPFALNESTRFISPTKTLEYMACGKPSVSTEIHDVAEPYGHVVAIRADAAGFVEACDALLACTPIQKRMHEQTLAQIVASTSWDATAADMVQHILLTEVARVSARAAQRATLRSLAAATAQANKPQPIAGAV